MCVCALVLVCACALVLEYVYWGAQRWRQSVSERDEQPERGWLFRGFVSAARRAAFTSGIHDHDTKCVAPPQLGLGMVPRACGQWPRGLDV